MSANFICQISATLYYIIKDGFAVGFFLAVLGFYYYLGAFQKIASDGIYKSFTEIGSRLACFIAEFFKPSDFVIGNSLLNERSIEIKEKQGGKALLPVKRC